jgi:hypothetical protein
VLDSMKGGYVALLMQVFPDISLDESQFDVTSTYLLLLPSHSSFPLFSPSMSCSRLQVNIGVIRKRNENGLMHSLGETNLTPSYQTIGTPELAM